MGATLRECCNMTWDVAEYKKQLPEIERRFEIERRLNKK